MYGAVFFQYTFKLLIKKKKVFSSIYKYRAVNKLCFFAFEYPFYSFWILRVRTIFTIYLRFMISSFNHGMVFFYA